MMSMANTFSNKTNVLKAMKEKTIAIPKYITADKIPCLKEEIMKIEKKKEGKGRLAAAYYDLQKFETYIPYAGRNENYQDLLKTRTKKFTKIGVYLGVMYGTVIADVTMASIAVCAAYTAWVGMMAGMLTTLPSVYRDFKATMKHISD